MAKGALNPADKARKEARKRELKKNKKQRQQVRSAVIENRNPEQILADLEQLDRREFDPENLKRPQQQQQPQQLLLSAPNSSLPHVQVNTDLLNAEKRKRLRELFAKCLAHYEKEDPERHAKLKSLEASYEARQKKIRSEFEAVRAAAEVSIEQIVLPPEPVAETTAPTVASPADRLGPAVPGAHSHQHQHNKQQHNHLARGMPAAFSGLRAGGAGAQEQQAHKRPRFVPSQARHRPPAQQHGGASSAGPAGAQAAASGGARPGAAAAASTPAVIESKPVIFMPKATKFVPASVRSKIRPAGAPADTE